MNKDKRLLWPGPNSQSGQSRRQAESIKKPGVLPELGESVHPGVVPPTGPTILKGDPWQENEWQFPILV
jgi:hypothetical protein